MSKKELELKVYIDALPIAQPHRSGVAKTLEKTLEALLKEDQNLLYVLVVPLGKAKFLPEKIIKNKNIHVKTLPIPHKAIELLLRLRLMPPMDLLIGRGVYVFPNFKNWPLWKSRSITYIHDLAFLRYPESIEPKNLKFLNRYVYKFAHRADVIVTVSEHAKKEIVELLNIPNSGIRVIYNGVDLGHFKRAHITKVQKVCSSYGLPDKEYLLSIGNIEPRKNLHRLVESYMKLPKKIRDKHPLVLIGGGGWNNTAIEKAILRANKQGIQVYRNSKHVSDDDLPVIISGARALVHPAIYEGFGIPPLESMSVGVPVASSNATSLPEVVGSAALTFDPHNSKEITSALEKILTDNSIRASVIKSGIIRAETFSWDRAARKLSSVIVEQNARGWRTKKMSHVIRSSYKFIDQSIRQLLGERPLKDYKFPSECSKNELRRKIYEDFMKEQPYKYSRLLLKIYIGLRHQAGSWLREAKSLLKGRGNV